MNDEQLLRYSRQILLPAFGIEGQQRLLEAKVLIIGLGGLGSPVAMYLAAAGVGQLRLNDFDKVDLSNLQRQILHHTDDLGKGKVESAKATLLALNPQVEIITLTQRLEGQTLLEQVAAVDVVVDCSDNLFTRLAINEACVRERKPLVSGAAIRFEGQISVFRCDLPDSPCYHCLYPHDTLPAETCSQTGVLAPLVGIIGSIQALETMKLIMQVGETLTGHLLILDALTMEWLRVKLRQNPNCPTCRH
jgi:adenylyltransferase/sulfurtransferase